MMTEEDVKRVVRETVQATLISIGLDTSDGEAIQRHQKNMTWLNKRVELEERVGSKVIMTVAVAAVGGVISSLVLGVKTLLHLN